MSDDDTTVDVRGLDSLLKALKNAPVARIGILGSRVPRSGGKLTNAQVGAAHEFGTSTLPVRSFLRMPLTALLGKELKAAGALEPAVLAKVIRDKSVVPFLRKVMVVAEGIVLGAFDSGGYGTWVPSDMRRKKVAMTLIESQQLRNSISSEIKE